MYINFRKERHVAQPISFSPLSIKILPAPGNGDNLLLTNTQAIQSLLKTAEARKYFKKISALGAAWKVSVLPPGMNNVAGPGKTYTVLPTVWAEQATGRREDIKGVPSESLDEAVVRYGRELYAQALGEHKTIVVPNRLDPGFTVKYRADKKGRKLEMIMTGKHTPT